MPITANIQDVVQETQVYLLKKQIERQEEKYLNVSSVQEKRSALESLQKLIEETKG